MDINLVTNISKEEEKIEIIVKAPEMTEEVQKIVNKIMQITNVKEQIIAVKKCTNYILSINEVINFYSEDKCNYCKTKDGVFKIKEKLYELEDILDRKFVRISNSCIINLMYVESFKSGITGTVEVTFKDKTKEYVSRRRVSNVLKKIREWGD